MKDLNQMKALFTILLALFLFNFKSQALEIKPGKKPNLYYISREAAPYVFKKLQHNQYYTNIFKGSSTGIKSNKLLYQEIKAINSLFALKKEKEALNKIHKTLFASEKAGDQLLQVKLLNLLGTYCFKYNVIDEGEKYFEQAFFKRLSEPDFMGYGTISLQLAEINILKKDFEKALNHNFYALGVYEKAGQRDSMAYAYFQQSKIHALMGDKVEAELILLKRALPLFSYSENISGRMFCFRELGNIYLQQKRFSEAKWFFIQQNILARSLNNKTELFNSLVNLGNTKIAIKDYNLAVKDLREAKSILNQKNLPENSKLEEAYSRLYKKQGNKNHAKECDARISKLKKEINKSAIAGNKKAVALLNLLSDKKVLYVAASKELKSTL